jgi:succinate dehydrogenase / fumarate reductase cytochrome b subunit
MANSPGPSRPLSPHLQVWKFHPTMLSSILHRASGVVNYVGAVLVAIWLIALASGEAAYTGLINVLNGPIKILVIIALIGFTLSLIYHMLNGIRHLVWDMGKGFDPVGSNQRSVLIMIASIVLTAVIWLLGLGVFG